MTIKAIGTDLCEVKRIEELLLRRSESALTRLFNDDERAYCQKKNTPAVHFAGRFAAKEAVLKVLGTGFVSGLGLEDGASFSDIEIHRNPSGKPDVRLTGPLLERAHTLGIDRILVTITHTRDLALAFAIGEGDS